MSEQPGTDSKITSKVPGEQELRGDYIHELQNEQENGVAIKDYSVSPVIKVTKEESTFTKGDLKVEKVVVSEDISDETANTNTKLTITELISPTEVQTEVYNELSSVTINTEGDTQTNTDQKVVYKVTKIPKLKFKQVVKKINKEEEMITGKDEAELGLKVTEAIQILKDEKNLLQEVSRSNSIQQDSPKVDDEFDRIYDEIFENGPPSGNFPSPGKIEDPDKLDTKFEEIIHAYDEQKAQTINAEKVKSKIPLLKRKSEQDIFAAKRTITKNSLRKRNSVDDTKCKLPVPLTKEKLNVELELQNQKTVSAKNVTVFETVGTNISKSITTSHQKDSEINIKKTEFNSTSDVSKSKIPTNLKNIVVLEKATQTKKSKISSQLSIEKSEDIFINAVNKNETRESKTVVKKEVKTLNVKANISNIKSESIIITDNVEKVLNTHDNNKKDTTNITLEKDIGNKNPVAEIETKTHIVTKVGVNNLKPINDSTKIEKPLDPKNSNDDFYVTNKPFVSSKTEEQKLHVNEPNSSISINQEVRETVRILSSQFSNSETSNIHHDQKNKINDNVTKNIPKDLSHIPSTEVYLETNSLAKEITNNKKNKSSDENTKGSDNINIDSKNATNITEQVSLKILDDVSQDLLIVKTLITNQQSVAKLQPQELTKEVTKNVTLQEHLNKSENNKDIINTTAVDTKQDKAILITNQQSVAKLQPQELTKDVTNNVTSQEHLNKSENNKEIIVTAVVDNKQDKAILITNQQSVAKLQPQELTKEVTKNVTSQEHLNKSENNKEIIVTAAVDNKQDKAILITNQQSVAKLQPQELTKEVTKNVTSQEHLKKSENNKEIIVTAAVDNKQDKAILITNQQSVAKLQPQELTKEVTKNVTSQEHLKKSENNKEIIVTAAVDNKQDKAILITNQQSVAKLQPQELTKEVTKNITLQEHLNKLENNKKITNSSGVDNKQDKAILITNQQSVAKLKPQELTKEVTKNITSQEHLNKLENNKEITNSSDVDNKQDKAILITNQQSVAKLKPQELTKEVTKNITSQEHLNKLENNKEITNLSGVDNKQDKAILITNQQSVAKLKPQELTKEVTKNITSQEHLNKSENNKGIINTAAVDNIQDKAILITNQQSVAKLQPQELTKEVTKNVTSQEHLNKSENNKDIINSTADTKQDKSITNQQSGAKLQPQELTKEVTKNITSQEHPSKYENISKKITTEINNNETKTQVTKDNKEVKVIVSNKKVNSSENNGEDNIEVEEEDIIILKGKVNRIIGRLDSKEFKVNKCELEDLTLEESVVSKIALFEQSNSVDTQKASIQKNNLADEINLDKPKIVDEVLKSDNRSLPSDSKFSYDTFLNYKKTIKNNISVNENKVPTMSKAKSITKFDEIYNTNINLNKFNKSDENKEGSTEEDVFFKYENANRNIINEYKMNKEIDLDMRRARSLAELNFDGVHGKVRQMVVRMNSIDKMALERREQNEVRRKTRHGSVSERIALFEQDANEPTVHLMKKVTPIRMESVSTTTPSPKPEDPEPALTEEELAKRITELAQARVTYGHYDNMTYIELSDGGRLPSLTVGTALLDSQLVKPIIMAAIDLGFRAIDTAYIYGNEQAIGEAIREKIQDGTVKREELFVLAKLWSTNHRQDLVLRACKQSLDIMGLDYFDLYLIHNPMSFKEGPNPVPKIANVLQYSEHDYMEAWFGIETLIKQGLVKRGGVSNFNSMQLERVLDKGKIKPVVNQVECHPYLSQTRLQDYMFSRGMAMSCFGTLGSSGTPRAFRSSLPPVINDPLVRTMAAGLGVTPAQLLISYQVFLGRSVVAKASSAAHLWNNLQALNLRLEPAHAAGLAALNRNKRTFTFEGMGDTHKNYPFKIPF